MTVRYDHAEGPSGGPTPGALALRDFWRETTGMERVEIYNPRRIRGSSKWSMHASGRGVDFFANANDPGERKLAVRFLEFCRHFADELGWQYDIFDRRSWKSGHGHRKYSGVHPHEDHIHGELNKDGAQSVTLDLLRSLWAAWANQEDDDVHADMIRAAYAEAERGDPLYSDPKGYTYWLVQLSRSTDRIAVVESCRSQLGLGPLPK